MCSKKRKNKVSTKEKSGLKEFIKITKTLSLDWMDYFTFSIHILLGAIILPLTFKVGIESVLSLAYTFSFEYANSLSYIVLGINDVFVYAQWPLIAVIIAIYWLRCNVKVYNYSFTQTMGAKIRKQLQNSDKLICPRCNKIMTIRSFTEKIREQVGEHDEYYTEWVGTGRDARPVSRKRTVADYSDVEYTRNYAVCQNLHCQYHDKKPYQRDVAIYKFFEMPYKISDTVRYAIRTKDTTTIGAGNIKQYSHGIPLFGYVGIVLILICICYIFDVQAFELLNKQTEIYDFTTKLLYTEGTVLVLSLIYQVAAHIRFRKHSNTFLEIRSQDKDGATIVLPDGTEIFAQTDHRLQNMYNMYAYNSFDDE